MADVNYVPPASAASLPMAEDANADGKSSSHPFTIALRRKKQMFLLVPHL